MEVRCAPIHAYAVSGTVVDVSVKLPLICLIMAVASKSSCCCVGFLLLIVVIYLIKYSRQSVCGMFCQLAGP